MKDQQKKARLPSKSPDQAPERPGQGRSPTPAMPNRMAQVIQYWGQPLFAGTEGVVQKVWVDEEIHHVVPGDSHIFLTSKKGVNIYTMGNNESGQLGLAIPDAVSQPVPFELKTKQQIKDIFTGSDFVFAITLKREVFSWGANLKGQLGLGHFNSLSSPARVRSLTPTIVGGSISAGEPIIPSLLGDTDFVNEVACGALHTLALTQQGRILACGFGETFALGNGVPQTSPHFEEVTFFRDHSVRPKKIHAGTSHSACLLGTQAYVWGTCGSVRALQYKRPTPLEVEADALYLALGDMLTVILNSKGEVFTLGDNQDGQLGTAAASHVVPKKVGMPYKFDYIDCGLNHVIALSKYRLFAWGSNRRGQIHPRILLPVIDTPMELEWITNSLPLAIHCGPQQTYLISREAVVLPERPLLEVDNTALLRKEIDAYKNKLVILKKENEKMKEEVKNIFNNINTLSKDGPEMTPRKGVDSNEDVMNKLKSELKLSRTLRPVFEIDLKEIKILSKISEGAFGIIYKAKWREITVAIKTLKQEYMKDDTIKDFLSGLTR